MDTAVVNQDPGILSGTPVFSGTDMQCLNIVDSKSLAIVIALLLAVADSVWAQKPRSR